MESTSGEGRIDMARMVSDETKVPWSSPSEPQRTFRRSGMGAKFQPCGQARTCHGGALFPSTHMAPGSRAHAHATVVMSAHPAQSAKLGRVSSRALA
eukprot:scaffold265340_cov30-Tisochrysis_lutea.AAC.1